MKKFVYLFLIEILSLSFCFGQTNLQKTQRNGKWGYIDDKGKEIIPCIYYAIGEFDENYSPVRAKKDVYPSKWTYVDRNGKDILGNVFYYNAFPFYEGDLALVGSENRFGYINKLGQIEIPIQYQKAYPFSDGLAAVKKEKKYGFINTKGEEVVKPSFSDVKWGFIDGFAWVKNGKKWGMIDRKGKTIVDFQYSGFGKFDPETGYADAITSQGAIYYYDAKGNKFYSAKAREDANTPKTKPRIEWPFFPSQTKEQLFVLNAEINSDSKIEYCKVYLNEILIASYGGRKINQVLTLNEGLNSIRIKVKNAGGVIEEQKKIEFKPESMAINKPQVVFIGLPSEITSSQLTVIAEITSESEIIDCSIYLKESNITPGGAYRSPDIIENKKKTISKTLTLREGRNIIVVEATNNSGTSRKESVINYVKPVPPTISWNGVPNMTTRPQFTVEASISSKSDVRWNISMISTGKTKGGIRTPDVFEIANGNGGNAKSVVTLKPGYNTISLEAINASGKKTESKTIWYSPCEKRIALVIGNKNYYAKSGNSFGECPLSRNDADTIAKLLENECGFINVVKVLDANYLKMSKAINDFIDTVKMRNYETAFIYYSGHGISFSNEEGDNYLIPIDCSGCKQDVITKGFDIKTKIIDRLSKEAPNCSVKIAMLDCCRSNDYYDCNPAPGSGGTKGAIRTKGLREMKIPEGISIWYAAEFEHLANVGKGPNSPFVECFVKYFRLHSEVNWPTMCDQVSRNVKDMTKNDKDMVEQYPIFDTRHMKEPQNFYLNPYHDKPY